MLRWWLIYCDMLELWLMPSYFKAHQMLFLNMMECHHTYTVKWQHSWIGSFLSDGLAEGGFHFLASTFSRSDPPLTFFCGALWKISYDLPMPITLNNLNSIWTEIAKIDKPLLQNVWHEVKYHLHVCWATNGAHIGVWKRTFWVALYSGVHLNFLWLLLSYK
jgi:hypothetical protein